MLKQPSTFVLNTCTVIRRTLRNIEVKVHLFLLGVPLFDFIITLHACNNCLHTHFQQMSLPHRLLRNIVLKCIINIFIFVIYLFDKACPSSQRHIRPDRNRKSCSKRRHHDIARTGYHIGCRKNHPGRLRE